VPTLQVLCQGNV